MKGHSHIRNLICRKLFAIDCRWWLVITDNVGFGATQISTPAQGSYHAADGITRNNLGIANSINIPEVLRWSFEHG